MTHGFDRDLFRIAAYFIEKTRRARELSRPEHFYSQKAASRARYKEVIQ